MLFVVSIMKVKKIGTPGLKYQQLMSNLPASLLRSSRKMLPRDGA
jgi:hypothetical protein